MSSMAATRVPPRRSARVVRRCVVAAFVVALVTGLPATAGASSWSVGLVAGSGAQARAGTLSSPTGVTGTCGTGPNKASVIVTWDPVARASSYTIQQSTTSATAGYTTVATGVTGTSWTSPGLSNNTTAWFRVVGVVGNWSSPVSAATAPRTISGNSCV